MKIFHIGGALSQEVGGPYHTVQNLCNHLLQYEDLKLTYIGSDQDGNLFLDRDRVKYYALDSSKSAADSLNVIRDNVNDFDVCHSHGVWQKANIVADKLSVGKVHVVTPRGMLLRWAFNHKRWKKQIAWWLYQKRIMQNADCLHATSVEEAKELRELGLSNPIAVIPNGVVIPDILPDNARNWLDSKWPELSGKNIMLFVSRIHKKKGLDMLADIWGNLSKKYSNWHLVVAGPDQADYWKEIDKQLSDNGSRESVSYVGPQYGQAKNNLLAACDVFILPTYSENFGIAVAEALAFGKPVVTTTGAPWNELLEYDCGWWVSPEAEQVKNAMITALDTDMNQLKVMGQNGRQLIQQKYSWDTIASQIYDIYNWLLHSSDMPESIWH